MQAGTVPALAAACSGQPAPDTFDSPGAPVHGSC